MKKSNGYIPKAKNRGVEIIDKKLTSAYNTSMVPDKRHRTNRLPDFVMDLLYRESFAF